LFYFFYFFIFIEGQYQKWGEEMETGVVRCAQLEDMDRLAAFLEAANLSTDGIKDAIEYFLIMENDSGDIKATLGIEPHGEVGLLRSLVMSASASENDLFVLFEQILMLARDRNLNSLYLASNKRNSLDFFRLLGFKQEETEQLPEVLFESDHVKHILTVDNSFFLKLSM
jgi:N-acetylglutamate synthase-like GNAT family acetyltransferase